MVLVVVCGFVVAVVAAVRSTWSPCGLSMLSSITPLGERGRGNRFGSTAAWFIGGAVIGGICLGAAASLLAWGWSALRVPWPATLAVAALAATLATCGDLGLLGFRIPVLRRQVNERWLDQFRGAVYGFGFGWQIGVGVATYIMTTGIFLAVALGSLSAHPALALGMGAAFGTVRGLAVLVGVRAATPQALRAVHRRMSELASPVRRVMVATQAVTAVALAAAWWWPSALMLLGAALAGVAARELAPAIGQRSRTSQRPLQVLDQFGEGRAGVGSTG